MSKVFSAVYNELGLKALIDSGRDIRILMAQRFVRWFAYGSSTLVLTLFLTGLGHSAEKTGLFMTLTLLGDVVISLILTIVADKIGRRRMLALGALLMSASGVAFALSSQYWILVVASIFGVISPSGNEIGPFRAIEESTISQLIPAVDRSSVIAWYTMCGTAGAAVGSVAIGALVESLQRKHHWDPIDSYRVVFWLYAVFGFIKFCFCLFLTRKCEVEAVTSAKKGNVHQAEADAIHETEADEERRPLLAENGQTNGHGTNGHVNGQSPDAPAKQDAKKTSGIKAYLPELTSHTVYLLLKLIVLFATDSLGSGIANNSWMVYYFNTKFGVEEGKLGSLFFFTNILSSASNLLAATLAKRIGLVKTMVCTHLPASALLLVISFPSHAGIAMAILLARASLANMDSAPRQAFLAAAVLPEERTAVMGIVNVCKTLAQAGGPIVTGALAGLHKIGIAFIIAGALKCTYDVLMLLLFLGYKTIEERAAEEVETEHAREAEDGIGADINSRPH